MRLRPLRRFRALDLTATWMLVAPAAATGVPLAATAQSPPAELARERADYADWLRHAPTSPLAAIARQPVGGGLRLGPADGDVPLEGVAEQRVAEHGGRVLLEGPAGERPLPRGRGVPLGRYTIVIGGTPGQSLLTVYDGSGRGEPGAAKVPAYYPYDPAYVFEGTLAPPERRARVRVLAVDGVEAEAAEAGTVTVPVGGEKIRLRVLRIPTPGGEESELEIFFRDGSNGTGTYPAGRFVSLVPIPGGRYRLDFNRARNPFCAYSTAFPCPAPWRGNTIPAAVPAGERYLGGGLDAPAAGAEVG